VQWVFSGETRCSTFDVTAVDMFVTTAVATRTCS
jgi:hypothetical protein